MTDCFKGHVRNVTDRLSNLFDLSPGCDRYVPGFGDANAAFHVIGDHPGVHGGIDEELPFRGQPWSSRFFETLSAGGLLQTEQPWKASAVSEIGPRYFSYIHLCDPGDTDPTQTEYDSQERFFDAELRAIAAHVVLPVGESATKHVFKTCTAHNPGDSLDMRALHATEQPGAGWLVLPIRTPSEWTQPDADQLLESLTALRTSDFRQTADLGRFLPGDDPYLVR